GTRGVWPGSVGSSTRSNGVASTGRRLGLALRAALGSDPPGRRRVARRRPCSGLRPPRALASLAYGPEGVGGRHPVTRRVEVDRPGGALGAFGGPRECRSQRGGVGIDGRGEERARRDIERVVRGQRKG